MEERVILHCDCNNFFASCECLQNPSIKDKPVVVAGSSEERKGVVLAKNYIAKKFGIYTGMRVYEAERVCKDLVVVPPRMKLYNEYSLKVKEIYTRFTDMVEAFSIDECFLDVTHSKMFGTGTQIADKIRELVKKELGLTISVGVSFCKVFAKIGSDLKKPDATTEITKENFKTIVWNLPVGDMIGVGKQTREKFEKLAISTIGDLANFPLTMLESRLGKVGKDLWSYANGQDNRIVAKYYDKPIPKSIGNSATFYRDLKNRDEVLMALEAIAESVASRMIKQNIGKAETLHLVVKNSELNVFQKQCKLVQPCRKAKIFAHTAYNLFNAFYDFKQNVRLLGISVSNFLNDDEQLNLFEQEEKQNLDEVVVALRDKFGNHSIGRASGLLDTKIYSSLSRAEFFKEIKDCDDEF